MSLTEADLASLIEDALQIACPCNYCGSPVGELCRTPMGSTTTTHKVRSDRKVSRDEHKKMVEQAVKLVKEDQVKWETWRRRLRAAKEQASGLDETPLPTSLDQVPTEVLNSIDSSHWEKDPHRVVFGRRSLISKQDLWALAIDSGRAHHSSRSGSPVNGWRQCHTSNYWAYYAYRTQR